MTFAAMLRRRPYAPRPDSSSMSSAASNLPVPRPVAPPRRYNRAVRRISRLWIVGLLLAGVNACGYEWKMVSLSDSKDSLFVDPTADERARGEVLNAWTSGIEKVRAFYGSLRADLPDGWFCNSDPCRLYFTGPPMRSHFISGHSITGAEFVAARPSILIVAINERMSRTVAHELSHVELWKRVAPNRVPAWFNEGVATYMSGEPACERAVPDAVPDLRSLSWGDTWETQTNDPSRIHATYCQARREFSAWFARAGRAGFDRLVERVQTGESSFAEAYGPMAIPPRS